MLSFLSIKGQRYDKKYSKTNDATTGVKYSTLDLYAYTSYIS